MRKNSPKISSYSYPPRIEGSFEGYENTQFLNTFLQAIQEFQRKVWVEQWSPKHILEIYLYTKPDSQKISESEMWYNIIETGRWDSNQLAFFALQNLIETSLDIWKSTYCPDPRMNSNKPRNQPRKDSKITRRNTVLKRRAIVAFLVEKINQYRKDQCYQCGESYIQRMMYFLQELFPESVNVDYSFMLYKYSPYSFELRDDIGIMVTEGILKTEPVFPYGIKIMPGDRSGKIQSSFSETLNKLKEKIEFVVKKLSDKHRTEIELLALALYIIKNYPQESDIYKIVEYLQEAKPYTSFKDSINAVIEVQSIIKESENQSFQEKLKKLKKVLDTGPGGIVCYR